MRRLWFSIPETDRCLYVGYGLGMYAMGLVWLLSEALR